MEQLRLGLEENHFRATQPKETIMEFASSNLTAGQLNALVKRLGGHEVVLRILREEFGLVWKTIATLYTLIVDYTMDLSDMISVGKYDWVNSEINLKNFPRQKSGKFTVEAELLHFGESISSENALAEMDKRGFRPATLEELLSFGATNPEVQREFPVVALGSSCVLDGYRHVPCLDRYGSKRVLCLSWFDCDWHGYYRFLVVRK